MNLRLKTNCGQLNTIVGPSVNFAVRHGLAAIFFFALFSFVQIDSSFASSFVSSTNVLNLPVAISFPTSPEAIEKSVIKFGQNRFRSGLAVKQRLDDVKISDPFAIQMSGVEYRTQINGRLDRDAQGLIVEAQLKNLELTIDRISIHTIVIAKVSGVEASIRIDAECRGSKISWADQIIPFSARARLATSPTLSLDVSGLSLANGLKKPTMTLSCQGPFGMDNLIREYAWAAIQVRWTDAGFAKEIEDQIESSFAKSIAIGGPGLNIINQPELRATVFPQSYVTASGAMHLRARLELQLDRPRTMPRAKATDVSLPTTKIEQVTMTVASSSAQSLLQEIYSTNGWSQWLEGQTINGFKELMGSRFKQLLVFPDLQNYPKQAPFWFALKMTETPTLICGAGTLEFNAPVAAAMLLQDPAQVMGYKPMVNFKIPTRISISLPQIKTKMGMAASVESMNLTYEFDGRYVGSERPNAIIAEEKIRDSIQEYVDDQLSKPTTIQGAIGETVKALNQTDMSCDQNRQTIEVRLP